MNVNCRAGQQLTTHGCTTDGFYLCQRPDECGDEDRYGGVCDKDGGSFHPYRLNSRDFYGYGPAFTVDSSKPMTVVTQFLTEDGTDESDLVEIRRIYVQDGVVIANAEVGYEEIGDYDSITDEFVSSYKGFFGEVNDYEAKGGLKQMGEALGRGVAISFCVWDDAEGQMRWLDSIQPPDADPSIPGVVNGPCPVDAGVPQEMQTLYPDAYVTFSNMKIGTINSTFSAIY